MQYRVGVELVVEFLDRIKLYRIIDDIVFHFSSLVDELKGREKRSEKTVDFSIGLLVGQLVAYFFHVWVDGFSPAQ